jgi:transcriptional regulator with XRE-family HTH domain
VLAGDPSLRDLASASGLSYAHLAAVERGEHPLTSTDARDLAAVLDVPADWRRHGWG